MVLIAVKGMRHSFRGGLAPACDETSGSVSATAFLALVSLLPQLSCADQQNAVEAPPSIVLAAAQPFISTESELIGYPTSLEVAPDGRVWVADFRSNRLLSVSAEAQDPRMIGAEGAGPGELSGPLEILVQDSFVRVLEVRNGRVQDLSLSGQPLATYRLPRPAGFAALTPDGRLALATSGSSNALVMVFRLAETASSLLLGPAVVPEVSLWDFTSIRARIRDGVVPDEFRNQASPVVSEDGGFWVIVQTEAQLRRYTATGELAWTSTFAFPEIEQARSEFFRKNNAERNPAMVHTLQTVADAREVGPELWILPVVAPGSEGAIYVLDPDNGSIRMRLSFMTPAPASQFAVDPVRRRLYLALAEDASVLMITLDQAVFEAHGSSRR